MPKHLLFDFGVVIIPIDQSLSYTAFEKLGAFPELGDQSELFEKLERGDLSTDQFLESIQSFFFRKNIFKKDLAAAWNAMCYAPIPNDTLRLLKRLSRHYNLYLLSNTNAMHIQKIKDTCGPFQYRQFTSLFKGIHYSHEMGSRKPEASFFQQVLKKHKLKAEDCFFIDDREENVEAAQELGIETLLFNPETGSLEDLPKLLKELQ